jgi:hypothetical protein
MNHQRRHLTRKAVALTATVVSVGVVTAGPVGADGAITPSAHATRTISLNETGRLHLVSKHGFTLNEQGTATGTIKGAISVRLTITSSSRVSAEVTISPKGGSISGSGTASYRKSENDAGFSGSLSVTRRSGSYAHAQGSGLKFSGTISRTNDAITVHVTGRLSE